MDVLCGGISINPARKDMNIRHVAAMVTLPTLFSKPLITKGKFWIEKQVRKRTRLKSRGYQAGVLAALMDNLGNCPGLEGAPGLQAQLRMTDIYD